MNHVASFALVVLAAAVAAGCSKREAEAPAAAAAAATAAKPSPADGGIDWVRASGEAEVDSAFARAKSERKPVFVYWGAKWCPPCNQLQATLFNRQDFIERSRAFVAVYVDGDRPGAQKLGTRFAVRGYPTTVVFDHDGRELTRLPGEVDAQQYNELLGLALTAQRPASELLALASSGGQGLSEADWRLLAWYSWETDQQQLVGKAGPAPLLRELANACPASSPSLAESAMRLRLKALAAVDAKAAPVADAAAQRAAVMALLGDAVRARRHVDVLAGNAREIVAALAGKDAPERAPLIAAFDGALAGLQADASLSRADRVVALVARVRLAAPDKLPALQAEAREMAARFDREITDGYERQADASLSRADRVVALVARVRLAAPDKLPALQAEVREMSARFDREISDGYERQAVITTLAWALEQAALMDESDALLKANLAKSHSPYYLMSDLADNARKRGDGAAALDWSAQAFDKSEGTATRLQWGASHLRLLTELAPKDAARIEAVAAKLIDEAALQPDAFDARSGRSMQRIGKLLRDWDPMGEHAAVQRRLQQRLDAVCTKLPGGEARSLCDGVLKPSAAT